MMSAAFWSAFHGLLLGILLLVGVVALLVEISFRRPDSGSIRAKALGWAVAITAWATVAIGTFLTYPAYRATPPEGATDLTAFARSLLMSDPATAAWHRFGMEWKEHVAWLVPVLLTAAAYVVTQHGSRLTSDRAMRRLVTGIVVTAGACVLATGILGVLIERHAPLH